MNLLAPFAAISLIASVSAAEVPKIFSGILEQNIPVRGQIGMVLPPREIAKYDAKVEAAARKDPKWFREYAGQFKPGAPLPFDERLGLTKEEYTQYITLWNQREFKPMEDITLLLRQGSGGSWSIIATGKASSISTLRYADKEDVFHSPNGDLKRIDDIKAESSSALGEWAGCEWKFVEETEYDKTKENFAIGKFAGNKYGLIVYVNQSVSTAGSKLQDTSLVIRFPLGKQAPAAKPAPTTDPADAAVGSVDGFGSC
jgi:hypothetical protein